MTWQDSKSKIVTKMSRNCLPRVIPGVGRGLAREMLHEGILHEQRRLVGEKPDRGAGGREMLHEGILHEQRRLVGETTGS